jgi:murein L,D-transpeptidase YcbB/YkuD
LRSALAQYRTLAAAHRNDPPLTLSQTIHPGDSYAGLPALTRRLAALGCVDVERPPAVETLVYDGPIVEAVMRCQERHGLRADGVIGPATRSALQVPLDWRVRQIEFALERLRWLPDLDRQRLIALNIPMFRFWAWDSILPNGEPALGMRAIVGRALDTQTPVFVEQLRYVVFRPYWNVPRSILRAEILPAVARDPAWLDRHNMEIVGGAADDAVVLPNTAANRGRLASGSVRLRQQPGPGNALGVVKFVFPNDADVYMHGTPAQELFDRSRRDFSHGCVRVEDPVGLAEWVLKDEAGWTRERILAAMSGPTTERVTLTEPIQVVLFYTTAAVLPEDGSVHFAADIYGHDRRLDRALSRLGAS